MFDNLFENRNRTVSDLIKIGDYLGRSLRENVSVFKIDVEKNTVCYVTESNKVIAATYDIENSLSLSNILVEDIEIFSDENKFDSLLDSKVSSFIKNIYEDSHKKAKSSFDDLLELWDSRLKFKNIKNKLEEKRSRFDDSSKIIESEEFQKFLEIAPELVNYLSANKDKISKISEIRNAVRLSQTVSEAFNIPKIEYIDFENNSVFEINEDSYSSIYDMICRHELIKKEILEHKANFNTIWASNEKVQNLAGLIYSEEDQIAHALQEAIKEVPYLAFASKKQLTETFKNSLQLNKVKDISMSEVQEFASLIFEMKKNVKKELISYLNEKYGINIQNLKDPASFKSLLNTQVVIFESLSKISPKKSVQREVLSNLAESLKSKSGVESIDCNDVIQELFIAAGYDETLISESLNNYLDFDKIATDLDNVGGILRMIKGAGATNPMAQQNPMNSKMQPTSPMGDDDVAPEQALSPEDAEENPQSMESEPEEMGDDMEAGMEEPPEPEIGDADLMSKMKELEGLIASLKSEIGDDEMAGADLEDEFGEEPVEEMPDEDEEIDAEQANLDNQEDAIEADHEYAHDMEDEAEEQEAGVKAKKKKLEKKEDSLKK